jgi:flagellar hook-associated protein 2
MSVTSATSTASTISNPTVPATTATSSSSSASSPVFTVGGLASGLDTNSIVDKLVAIESLPITQNQAQQSALTVQISSIGDLVSKIKALSTAATNLSTGGVTGYSVAATPSGVTATLGTGASAGTYSVAVNSVATAAKARSIGFASPNSTVAGGAISMTVQGTAYSVTIAANSDIGSVVQQINQSGTPVRAAVISDGTNFYVSLINRATGKPIGSGDTGGLTISDGSGLGLAITQNAVNAKVTIDGDLNVESQSNQVTNAIPGVTLSVNSLQTTAADLVINQDSTKSTSNLQTFVDSFNAIVGAINQSLRPDPTNPPAAGSTLDTSTAIGLQQQINGLLSAPASTAGAYHTLADIGVKVQSDGTLTLDTATLNNALTNDPTSVDSIFATASTGIAARASALSTRFTDSFDGTLVARQTSLGNTIKDLKTSQQRLQDYVDNFKANLQKSFANMETLISGYKTIGSFLTTSSAFPTTTG